MSKKTSKYSYRFDDWAGRIYDDPAIGTVEPGDIVDLDTPPADGHWTLVSYEPDAQDSDGNRGSEAADPDPTPVPADATEPAETNEATEPATEVPTEVATDQEDGNE
jgi:hypothetical protein